MPRLQTLALLLLPALVSAQVRDDPFENEPGAQGEGKGMMLNQSLVLWGHQTVVD